ncbi:rRNA biogenesis protein rrp5 [Orbilia blumenaviensis]|uniref:rRNA biogenesis protein RRP5 n=1 Tax=Orbilia blumenaviensis TaxID=1796055 RepID=A0AAV9VPJ6_9PEZI
MANKRKDGPSKGAADIPKSTKRQKTGSKESATSKTPAQQQQKPAAAAAEALTTQSSLRKSNKDEPSFPRGGASALTPLEYKEVVNEATREVLFETKEEKAPVADKTTKKRRTPAAKGSSTKKHKKGEVDDEEPEIKIEQLSYKKLVPGQLVFGFISKITKKDIAIALPNNLVGYAPLTSISEQYTNQLQASLEDEDGMDIDKDGDAEEAETEIPGLDLLFEVNQPVRAYVMNVSTGSTVSGEKKQRKHIELSLLPSLTNPGITKTEIVKGITLQASVKSIEDNGFIMDLGMDFVSGFMGKSDCGAPPNTIKVGRTFLCHVLGLASGGKVVQLASDFHKSIKGKTGKDAAVGDGPTIDCFLPGTMASKALITDVRDNGIVCTVMGSIDVTVDLFHSGCFSSDVLQTKYKAGNHITLRLLATIPGSENKKFIGSLLTHIKEMGPQTQSGKLALSKLPIGAIKSDAAVKHIIPGVGLILNIGLGNTMVFVHISRISDKKIDSILPTGPYKVSSKHAIRILDYNSVDGLLLASMEPKVLAQRYLRIEDVKPGDVVKGKISRFTAGGMLVEIEEGLEAYVPEMHMSDTILQHPEKKFREGAAVKGRILRVDLESRRIKMTLKKAIVNSEGPVFADYIDVEEDEETPGTIVKLMPTGAILEFYGEVRGFLPVSEMSEAFIKDPMEHFKVGQTLNVHVISSDPMEKKVRLSCRSGEAESSKEKAEALQNIALGSIVEGSIIEKSNDDVVLSLQEGIKGLIVLGHLTDGSKEKNLATFKKLRAGQKLVDLVVLRKDEMRNIVYLTAKPSLVKASKSDTLIKSISDVKIGSAVAGFVKEITHFGVFVTFINGITALLPRKALPKEVEDLPDFGYQRLQSITCYVTDIIPTREQFTLSLRPQPAVEAPKPKPAEKKQATVSPAVVNPVDPEISTVEDFEKAAVTKGRITAIKPTQLNIDLADNVKGRVDVSEFFNDWDSIKNKKHALLRQGLAIGQEIDVKVIGIHDVKSHKYLPISHRVSGKLPTFELSAKQATSGSNPLVKYSDLKEEETYLAFVNNVSQDHLWVNLSPSVRGRVKLLEISDDVSALSDLEKHYPVGAALRVSVLDVDVDIGKLELTARYLGNNKPLDWSNIKEGMMIPAKVVKISEGKVIAQLTETILGSISLADMTDDFDKADVKNFRTDSVLRVCVLSVDNSNKKIHLSTRPSRILDSSSKVRDAEVKTAADLKVGNKYRGFVTNVADNGVYIHLGGTVVARARISDLSDEFVKDWKKDFTVHQLVKVKVMSVDLDTNQVSISLKKSVIAGTAKKTLADYKVGSFVDGHVRKVTDYGCFIVIEGSDNVSGLCHKSQMSNEKDVDPSKLFAEGDLVKAKVLKVDRNKGRISFGLKASYFENLPEEELVPKPSTEEQLIIEVDEDEEMEEDEEDEEPEGGVKLDTATDGVTITGIDRPSTSTSFFAKFSKPGWGASGADAMDSMFPDQESSESEDEDNGTKKPKKKKNAIKVDLTGDLDTRQPQSASDYERLLLADPNDSLLWMAYMAFTVTSGDVVTARAISERAVKKIDHRNEDSKLNIWLARLNLELEFGTPETLDVAFKNACQYNDGKKIHQGLVSVYIQTGKHEQADELFQSMIKKFSQDEKVWINYMTYMMENKRGDDARIMLSRALQAIQDTKIHPGLTIKFAQLEYKSGEIEKGRTLFEKLLSAYPKRLDIWNVYIDIEAKQDGGIEVVRRLFPRVLATGKLNAKKANGMFNKWMELEERFAPGDKKRKDHVIAQAVEYKKKLVEEKEAKGDAAEEEEEGDDY